MNRHERHTDKLAPPPPSAAMAASPAYRGLTGSARGLLMLLGIEVQEQGGLIAEMTVDDLVAATGMRRPALVLALGQLAAGGFIVASMSGGFCIVEPTSAWLRT